MKVDGALSRFLTASVPARCLLCHARAGTGGLCEGCEDALPRIANPCRGCAMPLPGSEAGLCADCLQSPPAFDRAWAAFRLAAPVQGLIHGLKYSAHFGAAHLLGTLAAQDLSGRGEPLPSLLIPVPLHHLRGRGRGYNQALELARAMQTVVALKLAQHAARRVRPTSDQIGQSAAQRRQNLRGAFEVTTSLKGLHVALLDDVMTTGATLAELARMCRKAGAAKVEAWAIARAL